MIQYFRHFYNVLVFLIFQVLAVAIDVFTDIRNAFWGDFPMMQYLRFWPNGEFGFAVFIFIMMPSLWALLASLFSMCLFEKNQPPVPSYRKKLLIEFLEELPGVNIIKLSCSCHSGQYYTVCGKNFNNFFHI
jgi:hypothetical protein